MLFAATVLVALSSTDLRAGTVTLYDDTLGTTPGTQPWLLYADDSLLGPAPTVETLNANGVQFDTNMSVRGGYSSHLPLFNTHKNSAFPTLDPANGFALDFELEVLSESHSSTDRAGFSVIMLGDDNRGVELGFWSNSIFAQEVGFNAAESVAYATMGSETDYQLKIVGANYTLSANGTDILSGATRDYSGFGVPYSLKNYLFLGDDTTSAEASVNLGNVTLTSVPEPSAFVLLAVIGTVLALIRRNLS